MDNIRKFLAKLDPKRAKHVIAALRLIEANNFSQLDIKPLKGMKNMYRCRIGDIRILFTKHGGTAIVFDIGFRGNIYEK